MNDVQCPKYGTLHHWHYKFGTETGTLLYSSSYETQLDKTSISSVKTRIIVKDMLIFDRGKCCLYSDG